VLRVLKLSSNVSDVFRKVLKLSFEVDECKPLPDGNQFMGFVLTFICLGFGALQSNIADKCLRDHGASVNENMLYINGIGALIVMGAVVVYEVRRCKLTLSNPR
jgi:hypothetical protein